jgi:ribosomal protein S18 acetylase RimI-like enzyme
MALTEDRFLSEVLGRPVFRYTPATARDPAGFPAGSLVFARVPTADVAGLERLQDQGFRVVDVTVTLEVTVTVRHAIPGDRADVRAIAARAFEWSRFHLDPRIPRALADATRVAWTDNFFAGTYGDLLAVAEHEGQVAAYLLGQLGPPDILAISLIGTRPESRSRGLGHALVTFVAATPGVVKLRVGTQAANIRALQFYERIGFRTVSTEYVCHRHG